MLPLLCAFTNADGTILKGKAAFDAMYATMTDMTTLAQLEPLVCFGYLGSPEERAAIQAKKVVIYTATVEAQAGGEADGAAVLVPTAVVEGGSSSSAAGAVVPAMFKAPPAPPAKKPRRSGGKKVK